MKTKTKTCQLSIIKTISVLVILCAFHFSGLAQYSIVVNGPSDICGGNNTSLSISPTPIGLTVNWYKNNFLPPSQPFFTGSVLQSPETGIWTAEIITSTTPILQTVITQSVTIRTNLIYIESQFGTGSCTSLTLDENASNLVQMNLYDFYQWKKNGVSIPGANSYTYSASTTGVYTCVASLGCGTGTSNPLSITIENPPTQKTITASGALTFCQGGSVTFTIPATAGLTYQWQKNSVDIPGATSTSYVATQSGTYRCKEISVYCGFIHSTTKTVTVNQLPTPAFISASGPTTFCQGGSVVLSGNTAGGAWNTGGTASTKTITSSGDYYVTTSNSCGSVTSNHIIVTVNPLPNPAIISALGPTTICSGSSVVLSGNTFGGVWSVGGSTAQNLTTTTSGDYYVTTTNTCGNVNSNHIIVTVNPTPVPAVISASGPTNFCIGGNVTLSGNTTGGTWALNGTTNSSIVVNLTGDYYVTNTSLCGIVTSNHIQVTVNPQPVVSILGLPANNTFNCMDAPVNLTGVPAGGTFSGLGMTGNTFNPNVVGTNGGSLITYSYSSAPNCAGQEMLPIIVNTTDNCAIPQNVTVSQIAKKTAVISWNSSAAPSFKVRYRKTGTTTYLYKNINWTPCTPTTVQLTGLISNTNYTVDVKSVCASGTNTYSSPVTFKTLITNPVIPTTESRTIEDESFEELEESSTTIFPNPFENSLEIISNELEANATVSIRDYSGRVVYATTLHESMEALKINSADWKQGIYFLQLNTRFFKLIKQ